MQFMMAQQPPPPKWRLYLDLCCFNRPYDDQRHARIALETQAKLLIQERIRAGVDELLWSSVLDYENAQNPFEERRYAIAHWRVLAVQVVMADASVLALGESLVTAGVGRYDALHAAAAVAGRADLFVTTDDRLLKKLRAQPTERALPLAVLPGEALALLEHWYEDEH